MAGWQVLWELGKTDGQHLSGFKHILALIAFVSLAEWPQCYITVEGLVNIKRADHPVTRQRHMQKWVTTTREKKKLDSRDFEPGKRCCWRTSCSEYLRKTHWDFYNITTISLKKQLVQVRGQNERTNRRMKAAGFQTPTGCNHWRTTAPLNAQHLQPWGSAHCLWFNQINISCHMGKVAAT